ncbi:hypothetical protein ES705_35483 [subsurface metagenome]
MSGVSDAIMMGYLIALLVNAQFQYSDDSQANLNLLIDRYSQISEHPEQIIPLVFTKVERRNTYGWFGILVVSSVIVHFKFTPSEVSILDTVDDVLFWISTAFTIYFLAAATGPVGPALLVVLGIYAWNIFSALSASNDHHSNGYAWISFEFFGWPYIGSYIHGYAQSGSTVYNFLFIPDPVMSVVLYLVFEEIIHDWTWMSI